jgi:hypothetical protein
MFVHSCSCILIFVLSGLILIQKRIQNLFEIPLKNWKKKKKENIFHFILGFRPIGPAAIRFFPRLISVVRSASCDVDSARGLFPALPWAKPVAGPLPRAPVLSLSPLSLADVVGRVSGLPPSSSRRQ